MDVKELIEDLKKYPENMSIYYVNQAGCFPLEYFEHNKQRNRLELETYY